MVTNDLVHHAKTAVQENMQIALIAEGNHRGLMHKLLVTTGSSGPGNSGDIDFCLCKARVYVQHCGTFF